MRGITAAAAPARRSGPAEVLGIDRSILPSRLASPVGPWTFCSNLSLARSFCYTFWIFVCARYPAPPTHFGMRLSSPLSPRPPFSFPRAAPPAHALRGTRALEHARSRGRSLPRSPPRAGGCDRLYADLEGGGARAVSARQGTRTGSRRARSELESSGKAQTYRKAKSFSLTRLASVDAAVATVLALRDPQGVRAHLTPPGGA